MATTTLRIIVDAITTGATSALSGLGAAASVAGKTVAAGWTIAAASLAATTVSVFKTGVEFNTLNQRANAAFETILGSAEAATAMMADITAFAKTSPFPRQAFITAAQQMAAFGIESQKVIPYLGAVQDAVAASGGGAQQLSEITFVMSQISAAGKITGQDLIQFGQRGINAAELIGSQMGKTGAQIKEDITEGALGADEALDALAAGMAERFGGAADKVKETWIGATDRIKGAIRDIGAAMAEPFVAATGGGLGVEWANLFADALRALQPIIQAVVDKILVLFGPQLSGVTSALGDLVGKLQGADAGGFASSLAAMAPALGAITGAFAALSGGMLSSLPIIGPLLGGLSGPIGIVVAAIAGLIAFSPELQQMFGGILQDALAALTPMLPVLSGLLRVVAGSLGQILTALAPVIPVFASLISTLVSGLAPIIALLVGALMPPLITIIDALMPVVAALGEVFGLLIPPIAEIIGALLPPLITILNMTIAAVAPLIPPVLDLVLALVGLAVKAVMPLLPVLVQLLGALMPIFQPLLRLIEPVVGLVAALTPLINKIAELAGIIVGALAGALGNLLSGALTKIAPMFDAIANAIGWVVDKLSEFVAWLGRIKIPDWLRSAGSWVGGLFSAQSASVSTMSAGVGIGARGFAAPALAVVPRSTAPTINIVVNAPMGGGDAIGRAIRDELTKLSRRRTGVQIGGPGVVFG